jgi:hypothetical protein
MRNCPKRGDYQSLACSCIQQWRLPFVDDFIQKKLKRHPHDFSVTVKGLEGIEFQWDPLSEDIWMRPTNLVLSRVKVPECNDANRIQAWNAMDPIIVADSKFSEVVDSSSPEYQKVETAFLGSLLEPWHYQIQSVQKNHHSLSQKRFLFWKEQFREQFPGDENAECLLFHGTGTTPWNQVVSVGLESRATRKSLGVSGHCIWGSVTAEYPLRHNKCNENRILLVRFQLGHVQPIGDARFQMQDVKSGYFFDSEYDVPRQNYRVWNNGQAHVSHVIEFSCDKPKLKVKRLLERLRESKSMVKRSKT